LNSETVINNAPFSFFPLAKPTPSLFDIANCDVYINPRANCQSNNSTALIISETRPRLGKSICCFVTWPVRHADIRCQFCRWFRAL